MNGYVFVTFSNEQRAGEYCYMVPDTINLSDIQRYVVVENSYYHEGRDISPYKIVAVKHSCSEAYFKTHYSSLRPTKYIVDTIDGETYKINRDNQEYKNKLNKKMTDFFGTLDFGEKVELLYDLLDDDFFD